MKKLTLIPFFFNFLFCCSVWADCIACGNPFASVMPVEAGQLEEVTGQMPCRIRVEKQENGPFGATSFGASDMDRGDSEDECSCIIGKNINTIKNDYLKQKDHLHKAFARMMEGRSFANMERLTTLGQNMEMMGADLSGLVRQGGVCDLKTQFNSVSCRNNKGFEQKLANFFTVEGKEGADKLSVDDLVGFWLRRGRQAVLGDAPNMDSGNCLSKLDTDFISLSQKRTSENLKIIGEFINRDGLVGDFNPNYRAFDRLISEEGLSPRAALEKLRNDDLDLQNLRQAFEGYPTLLFMLEDKASFEELKGIFSGNISELNDPEKFLNEKFSGNSNHQRTVVQKMKDSCQQYTRDLEMLLCGDVSNPYVLDEQYNRTFSDVLGVDDFEGANDAFRCHAAFCTSGKVFEGLEGYCLNREGNQNFSDSYRKALSDFGSDIGTAESLVNSKASKLANVEEGICPFLMCSDEELEKTERQCHADRPRNYNEIEAMIARAQCPPGGNVEDADINSICNPDVYKNLMTYIDYQKKLQAAGMLVVEEVPDLTVEPDEDGVYPTTQVMTRNRKASFAEELWSLGDEEAEAPSTVKSGHLRTGKQGNGGDSTVQRDQGFGGTQIQQRPVESTKTTQRPAGNDRFARQQLEQAKRLANAAIGMAENASRISEAAVDRFEEDREDPSDERQRLASFGGEGPSNEGIVADEPTLPQRELEHTQAVAVADQDEESKTQQQTQWRKPAGSSAQELGDSVIDIADNGPVAGVVTKDEESEPVDESEAVGSATRVMPTGAQTLTVNKTELPELVEERLEEQGVDVDTPFVIEVVVDGKVVKVLVEPITIDGKTLLKPDLDQLKESDPELYEAIKNTPIFKDYLEYLRSSREYSWGDVVKMLPTGQEKEE